MPKKIPKKWESGGRALKAAQVAIDASEKLIVEIKREACMDNMTPSDKVRQIVGLAVASPPKRPRLTMSLKEEDFAELAKRYGCDPTNSMEIKRRVLEELMIHVGLEGRKD